MGTPVGVQIAMTRLKLGLNQQAVSDLFGVKQGTLSRWEHGGGIGHDLELIQRIAAFLERPFEDVLHELTMEQLGRREVVEPDDRQRLLDRIRELEDEVRRLRGPQGLD